jgi:hypothetical protein
VLQAIEEVVTFILAEAADTDHAWANDFANGVGTTCPWIFVLFNETELISITFIILIRIHSIFWNLFSDSSSSQISSVVGLGSRLFWDGIALLLTLNR